MADAFTTYTLLNAVAAITTGTAVSKPDAKNWTFHTISSSVTTGGSVKLQVSQDNTNFTDLVTHTITTNGTTSYAVSNQHWPFVRAALATRTDGTYTVYSTGGD